MAHDLLLIIWLRVCHQSKVHGDDVTLHPRFTLPLDKGSSPRTATTEKLIA
jgi:hypothetical protein